MNAYDKAISLLSIREHSEKELRSKLSDKGYSQLDIDSAIERAKNENLLSDSRFAEIYIRSRLKKSPEGKAILLLRLAEKGVSKDDSSLAISSAWNNKDWLEPLSKALEKLERRKSRDEAIMCFRKKGFSSPEINEALSLFDSTSDDME